MFGRFLKFSIVVALFPALAFGVQAPNPRGGNARSTASSNDANMERAIRRSATTVIARSVERNGRKNRTVVKARPASALTRAAAVRAGRDNTNIIVGDSNISRAATSKKVQNIARSAKNNNVVRSGVVNVSRAGSARATAVFNDVSKIGGGYADCRDSYATCMDQFCANANDTYRRCYCSERFVNFRNTSDSLDQALSMLADFQNTNLDAVNKTAAEVNAMYSASEGEAAIKRDTSASQKLLDNIGELLSGKNKYKSSSKSSVQSSNVLDISGLFGSGSDDVFSGDSVFDSGTNSIFSQSANSYANMSDMEGDELFNAANRQCSAISRNECGSDAVFNLARSAYSIMITQDCNLYEKNINAKRESVQETVRTAEKYLREARLEEYRAHNSPDVNSCLDKVDTAMRQSTACGANYERCLDYTGRYINSVTGEPIYSKALFDLNNLIILDGSADVVGANPGFNTFLEDRKMFATQALDTCREIADTVWNEFKRSAIINIAQAQDAKIEEIKNSCVQTISECYDTQTGALDALGGESAAKKTGAISAIAAHDMCKDQVLTCASLYGDPNACVYNDKDKTLKDNGTGTCGLKSLLAYVNTVDSIKVAQGCETSLREYAQELCSDDESDYPWGCRLRSQKEVENLLTQRANLVCGKSLFNSSSTTNSNNSHSGNTIAVQIPKAQVSQQVQTTQQIQNDKAAKHNTVIARNRASQSSVVGTTTSMPVSMNNTSSNNNTGNTNNSDTYRDIDQNIVSGLADPKKVVASIMTDIRNSLSADLADACYRIVDEGTLYWAVNNKVVQNGDEISVSPGWMEAVYGTSADLNYLKQSGFGGYKVRIDNSGLELKASGTKSFGWGVCIKPTTRMLCNLQSENDGNKVASYNESTKKCEFTNDWYSGKCAELGGYWAKSSNSSAYTCYVK